MRTPPFNLHFPTTVEEAIDISQKLASEGRSSDWIAGGTDLLPNYKWRLNPKGDVISLSSVAGLGEVSMHRIGAMARLSSLVADASDTLFHTDATISSVHPIIAKAAGKVASILIRNNATLGGNICLDTRCYWFNQSEDWRSSIDWCHKCDCGTGADCRVIPNQNELCVATYQADIAPTLMVLGASIHLAGPQGQRSMLLSEFFQLDGMTRNILQQGELVTHVSLPEDVEQWEGDYLKLSVRESWDFPEVGIAAAWKKNSAGELIDLRVASTALESIPKLHSDAVAKVLQQGWQGQTSILEVAELVRQSIKPVKNTYLAPAYRRKMAKVLTKRVLSQLE
ncbi:MAG: hypothetical protein HOB52_03055 [Euryarchaeota archaeon]|jgi:4-hydroxybenzoyl-CoA reductase subunit beta|nr:hypothetical protein [Euryarchaeota archaeon]